MFSTQPTERMAERLTWEGDRCELRLDPSAVRCFSESSYDISRMDFLCGSSLTLLRCVQGITLVTLIHRDLVPQLRLDRSDGDYDPMISSSVSFDGDTMHKLKQDFVRNLEIELRQKVLSIHFSVLNGITGALPRGLTRDIRNLGVVATGVRWGLVVLSLITTPFWTCQPSQCSHDPFWSFLRVLWAIIQPLLWLVACKAPIVVRWLVGRYIKSKLHSVRKVWQEEVSVKGAS